MRFMQYSTMAKRLMWSVCSFYAPTRALSPGHKALMEES